MSMYTDSESAQIAVTTVHSFLALLDIAGNSLVCVVILRNQDMRYARTGLLVSCSDIREMLFRLNFHS